MATKDLGLSRRNIVKAATIVPFSAVVGSAANSAVTVGLIGSGGRGSGLARFAEQDKRGRVVALSDLLDEKIELAKKKIDVTNPKIYKDYRELLASDVDAVIIATPHHLHPEHFEAAIKAKKHIYLEKPVANTVAGCKRIMRAADSADRNLNLTIGLQRRYGYVYKKAKALFDSGSIGEIRMARADFIKGEEPEKEQVLPRPTTDRERYLTRRWGHWEAMNGHAITGNEVHSMDVVNWFLESLPIKAIGTGGRTVRTQGDLTDHAYVIYDYPKEVQAVLTGSVLAPRYYRDVKEQFFTATDMVETSQGHPGRQYWKHHSNTESDTTKPTSRKGHVAYEDSPTTVTQDAIESFVARVADGKPENTGIQGAESTLTAILGSMAATLRREVSWDEMMESE